MDILPEAASEFPALPSPNETGDNSKGIVSLISAFENADTRQSIIHLLWKVIP